MTDLTGKRILVTGGAGFLGRYVCTELEKRQPAEIIVPRSADYDLVEQSAVRELFANSDPDIVIHLAAEVGGIGANRANPGRYFYANATMGINIIEQSRLAGVEKVTVVGTVCSYPKFTPVPFREDTLWEGFPEETNAPYGIAKKALLTMLDAYRDQYGLGGIYLIPVNLYGPGDNFDPASSHVIPALIRKFSDAVESELGHVDVWGTGTASREFLYVEDAAAGIVMATERYDGADPVNLGTGHEITIRELVDLLARLTGFTGEVRWDETKPDGQPRRALDITRAQQQFDWVAQTALEDGLKRTIDWWRGSPGSLPLR